MRLAQADAKVDLSRFADVVGSQFHAGEDADSGRVLSQSRARYRHGGRHRQGLLGAAAAVPGRRADPSPGQMQQETAIAPGTGAQNTRAP